MIKNQRKIPTPVGWIREKTGVSSPPTCTTAAVVSAGRKRKLSSNFFSESVKSLDGSLDHHSISDIVYLTDNRHLIPTLAALPVQRSTNGTLNDCPVCPLTSVPPSVLIQHMTVTHQGKLDLIEKVVNFQDERIPERKLVFDSDTCEFCSEIFPCKSVCLQHVMAIHEKDLIKCPAGAKTDIRIEVLLGQSVMSTGEKYNVTMSLGCPVKRTSMDGRANSSPPVYSL